MTTVEPIRNVEDIRKVEKFLANKSKRDLIFFTIGTNCGLRISDIVALNVGDVRYKSVPINSKLKPMFEDFTRGKHSNEALFITRFKNRMDRFTAYRIIKSACKESGLQEKVGTHTMRKTFGYHHYQKFKDVAILQKIFNHSSPQITLRYIGIEQDQIDESYTNFIL